MYSTQEWCSAAQQDFRDCRSDDIAVVAQRRESEILGPVRGVRFAATPVSVMGSILE
jgi:hypothetical protein